MPVGKPRRTVLPVLKWYNESEAAAMTARYKNKNANAAALTRRHAAIRHSYSQPMAWLIMTASEFGRFSALATASLSK